MAERKFGDEDLEVENIIKAIGMDKLTAHPDNPNRMGKAVFNKLVRNIEMTGKYEPLIVRVDPEEKNRYQIINGHHRCKALKKLGIKRADCVVWDIDDEQAQVFLMTLNRLSGRDELGKKISLLKKLSQKNDVEKLGRILPIESGQIDKLIKLKRMSKTRLCQAKKFAEPLVFFVDAKQGKIIESAIEAVISIGETKAQRRAAALVRIAEISFGEVGCNRCRNAGS